LWNEIKEKHSTDEKWLYSHPHLVPLYLQYSAILEEQKGRKKCHFRKPGDACVCNPRRRPDELKNDYYIRAPNPLFISDTILPEYYNLVDVIIWEPLLIYGKWIRHLPCPKCITGNLVISKWVTGGPRTVNACPKEYAILTKVI
jgi:hypothetical protein